MTAGYSGTPLVRKLGIRAGMTWLVLDPPGNYRDLLPGLPDDLTMAAPASSGVDFVHVFVRQREGLKDRMLILREQKIAQDGMIWVSWPKKASGVDTDVSGDVVRQAGLSAGLVDVKVCAIDDVWSGLKFVIPKADRR